MKKIIALLVMTFGLFLFNSCEEVITLEPCEKNNTGTFIILNTLG